MEIKFKVKTSDLSSALDIVSVVTPRPISSQQSDSGYLFTIKNGVCQVYSYDASRVARAEVKISDPSGDGSFVYPAGHVSAFKFLGKDEVITLEASDEGGVHKVSYKSESGACAERTTLDPRSYPSLDKEIESATNERKFPAVLLLDAFRTIKPFMAEDSKDVDEALKGIQIFDGSTPESAKCDGTMYAANGIQAFYYESDSFKGKSLAVHGKNLGCVQSFLSKVGKAEVTFKDGGNKTFAFDHNGNVLGWSHHVKTHSRFRYYSKSMDLYVLTTPVVMVANSIGYMMSEMGKGNKVRVSYNAQGKTLTFKSADGSSRVESYPIPVVPKDGSKDEDISFYVNIKHFKDIFDGAKGNEIELRIGVVTKGSHTSTLIRTMDEFVVNENCEVVGGSGVVTLPQGSFRCQVTKFTPSKD
jgi:DNA polymerase III sliding clamp (beta) subunit (PCNA family)